MNHPKAERRARRLLHWYPERWRARYGDEFTQLLIDDINDQPRSWRRTLNIAQRGLATRLPRELPRRTLATTLGLLGIIAFLATDRPWASMSSAAATQSPVPAVSSVAWSPDGKQLAVAWESVQGGLGIYRMRPDGSDRVDLTPTLGRAYDPAWSPDGRRIAFDVAGNDPAGDGNLMVMNADGSHVRLLAKNANEPAWSPNGRLIVAWTFGDGTADRLELFRAGGVRVRTIAFRPLSLRLPSWSKNGRWIRFYGRGGAGPVYAIRPNGRDLHVARRRYAGSDDAWSPNGRLVAYTTTRDHNGRTCRADGCSWNSELYVQRPDGESRRLTFDDEDESMPVFSPDGHWIAFVEDGTKLLLIRPHGTGEHPLIP